MISIVHSRSAPWTRRLGISAAGWRVLVGDLQRLADLLVVAVTAALAAAPPLSADPRSAASFPIVVIGCLLASQLFALLGIYRSDRLSRPAMDLPRALLGWTGTILCLLVMLFAFRASDQISRLWLLLWFGGASCGLVLSRIGMAYFLSRAHVAELLVRRVAVVGSVADVERLVAHWRIGEPGYRIAAVLPVDGCLESALPPDVRTFRSLIDLEVAIGAGSIDKIVLAVPPTATALLADLVPALRCLPVEVGWAPELPDLHAPILGVADFGGIPVFRLSERPLDGWRAILKSGEDRVLATLLLLVASPAFLLIAAAIKLDSRGPVFFRQRRRGFSREAVPVLKFRSMYHELCDLPDAAEVRQASRDDPRITRVGRLLRRTSLDELPQLINVLRGEMSLVGPRPHAVAHDQHYGELIDNYLGRHRVKPGITGWAQVNGYRGETETLDQMQRRVELDLHYIDHWSIWLDLQILFRTLLVGFVHKKAY